MPEHTESTLQSIKTDKQIYVRSKSSVMVWPFVTKLAFLLISFYLADFFDYFRYWADGKHAHESNAWVLLLRLIAPAAWAAVFVKYFPKKWLNSVLFDIENQTLTIENIKKSQVIPFSEIQSIRFEAAPTISSTKYLFFYTTFGVEQPLVALADDDLATAFFFRLQQGTSLKVEQFIMNDEENKPQPGLREIFSKYVKLG